MCTTKSISSPAQVLGFPVHKVSMSSFLNTASLEWLSSLFGEQSRRCRWCASDTQAEFAFTRDQTKGPSQVFVLRKERLHEKASLALSKYSKTLD